MAAGFAVCWSVLALLSLLLIYQWFLAVVSMLPWGVRPRRGGLQSRLLLLIPAYNEEAGIAATLNSLERVDYPKSRFKVVVVADRCDDGTAACARGSGVECLERRGGQPGKGPAIAWAVDELQRQGVAFDALVLVDADTVVDPAFLDEFDQSLRSGHEVQQGYNYLSNPFETPFTRIISVTSVLRNGLFYAGKERLGLPAMLSGSGMCFSRRIIERYGWTAFSVGEDWEFSASLLLNDEKIHFNARARVMARESRGFQQASTQRLRWASGRHAVAGTSAAALLGAGVRRRRADLCDAALTLSAPPYSAQATLALLCLVASLLLSRDPAWKGLALWAGGVTAFLAAYFAAGLALTEAPLRALAGIVLIPVFLPWRMAIEILGMLGYGRRRWVRTARVSPSN